MISKQDVAVVAMCCDGPYQRDLIRNIEQAFDLAGVIFFRPPNLSGGAARAGKYLVNPVSAIQHVAGRLVIRSERRKMPSHEFDLVEIQDKRIPMLSVTDINAPEAVEFLQKLGPELVMINGTNLLRQPMLELIPTVKFGVINLHTGLSPYTRGGNCNLFSLLEGKPELVGITIHHISPGIDSGDIIISARPVLKAEDTFEEIENKCFILGIEKLIEAGWALVQGTAKCVPQWEDGKLFLNRTGYSYSPWHRYLVARKLKNGMINEYLNNKIARDKKIALVGSET